MGTLAYLRQRQQTAADASKHPERASKLDRLFAGGVLPSGLLQWDQRNVADHNQGMVYLSALKIAEEIGSATLNVYDASYQKQQGRAVRKAFEPDDQAGEQARLKACPDHPVARLLRAPNPIDDQNQFLKKAAFQYLLTGGCLIWDVRNRANQPIELYVIPRAWAQYQRPNPEYPVGWYRVTNNLGWMYQNWTGGLGATFNIDVRSTIRFGDPHALYPGEYYSRLTACADELDVYFQTIRSINAGMRNRIKPGTAWKLSKDLKLSQEQIDQWKTFLENEFKGADNVGKNLLTGGFEPVPIQVQDDGSAETRDQNRQQVQRTFGAPDALFGALDVGTYSGIAAIMKAHRSATLDPPCKMIAGVLTRRFEPLYGKDYKCELKPADYDDPEMSLKRSGELKDAAKSGGATWNEWRVSMGLEARPELDEIQKPQPAPGEAGADDGMDLGVQDAHDQANGEAAGDADTGFDLGVGGFGDMRRTGMPDASKNGMPRPAFSLNGKH